MYIIVCVKDNSVGYMTSREDYSDAVQRAIELAQERGAEEPVDEIQNIIELELAYFGDDWSVCIGMTEDDE